MAKALKVTRLGNSVVDDPPLLPLLRFCDLMTGFSVFGFDVISPVDAAKSRIFCVRLVLPLLPVVCTLGVLPPPNKSWCDATTGCCCWWCTAVGPMYLCDIHEEEKKMDTLSISQMWEKQLSSRKTSFMWILMIEDCYQDCGCSCIPVIVTFSFPRSYPRTSNERITSK